MSFMFQVATKEKLNVAINMANPVDEYTES